MEYMPKGAQRASQYIMSRLLCPKGTSGAARRGAKRPGGARSLSDSYVAQRGNHWQYMPKGHFVGLAKLIFAENT